MTDRPIIFSAPMVQALLDGRKTQTRRVLKPQPPDGASCYWAHLPGYECWMYQCRPEPMPGNSAYIPHGRLSVPYALGDRLWVREGHMRYEEGQICAPHYLADGLRPSISDRHDVGLLRSYPSIHMPRWASRLTLTVTDIRVQRLKAISKADAVAEGVFHRPSDFYAQGVWTHGGSDGWHDPISAYRDLWNRLYAHESWGANPWIVALTFAVQRGNIDQIGGE